MYIFSPKKTQGSLNHSVLYVKRPADRTRITVRESLEIDIDRAIHSHESECKRYVLRNSQIPLQDPAGATPP
jgi:hypothetical protein